MVAKTDYPGPTRLTDDGHGTIETHALRLIVTRDPPALRVIDRPRARELLTLSPAHSNPRNIALTIDSDALRHAYGLGQQFVAPGRANGDWSGHVRTPGCEFGNALVRFDDGYVGNTQFPILYALGAEGDCIALFLDHSPAQTWDLRRNPWTLTTTGPTLRGYVLTGPDLPDLRCDYMELVGRPLVPPRKAFGLWVSEFGFEDWDELKAKLASLRAARFPVDGFILDLQWFGGVTRASESSRMGRLAWDELRFPDPRAEIAALRDRHGVGLIHIEESYVSAGLPEHERLLRDGGLVRRCNDARPVRFSQWWGAGGMIDWTHDAAADRWHDIKRNALIDDGLLGHWTDLGEPETFDPRGCFAGVPGVPGRTQHEMHNLYNFKWIESIARGYARRADARRPFVLSRSGAPGIQRFGAAMWSGDIASKLSSLAAHFNVQMHMSFAGIDYFGADVGGFHRTAPDRKLDETYTRWFAAAAAFDVPLRPHASNLQNAHETAPDRIGHRPSNLRNLQRRYVLVPYLYSLAHHAHRTGDPVFPPPLFYFPDDPSLREMAGQKMIGRDLLVAAVAVEDTTRHDVYLPAGRWFNYETGQAFDGRRWLRNVPLYVDDCFTLPLFARAGAILPHMHVDEHTLNAAGLRDDGTRREELVLRVYPDPRPTEFTLFEDDGESTAYLKGAVRSTRIRQRMTDRGARIDIERSEGTFAAAPPRREVLIHLVTHPRELPRDIRLNGSPIPRGDDRQYIGSNRPGCTERPGNVTAVYCGYLPVDRPHTLEVRF